MVPTRDLFAQQGLRCTTQRVAVYESLRQSTCHPTADELFRLVKPLAGQLSRATVYNTLEVLCQAGLVRRMPGTDGCCRFDADMHPHVHVSVPETNEIHDVPEHLNRELMDGLPRRVLADIAERLGIEIDSVNIEIVGRRTTG